MGLLATMVANDVTEAYDAVEAVGNLSVSLKNQELTTKLTEAKNKLFEARVIADRIAHGA